MLSRLIRLAAPAAALLLAACTTPEPPVKPAPPAHPEVAFEESSFDRLPQIQDHTWEPALAAFQRSCEVMQAGPVWEDVCRSALATDPIGAQRFFLANFTPWKVFVANDDATLVQDTGLMTGYYEPELPGREALPSPIRSTACRTICSSSILPNSTRS